MDVTRASADTQHLKAMDTLIVYSFEAIQNGRWNFTESHGISGEFEFYGRRLIKLPAEISFIAVRRIKIYGQKNM